MIVTLIVIAVILLWLTGFFGPPVIPEIALPTLSIPWSDPLVQAVLVIVVIVVIVLLLR